MKKAQGEIFGVALFFVVIIVGIIIYANISALQPDMEEDSFKSKQYEILSSDALNGLKKMSTSCQIEQDKDSLEDLIRYCFSYASGSEDDPVIECQSSDGGTETRRACEHSFELLNKSLHNLFDANTSEAIVAPIPFSLELSNPDFEHEQWHNRTITNVGEFGLSLEREDDNFYLRQNYQRKNAGFDVITTGRRDVELNFNVYYE